MMALVALAFFSAFHLITPTLPLYLHQRGMNGGAIGVMVSAFMAASLITRPLMGRWADLASKKRLIVVGAACFAACAPCYLLPLSDGALFALRLIHGAAFSLFVAAYYGYLLQVLPQARRAEALSAHSNVVMLALALGPMAGLWLMETVSIGLVFWTMLALGIAALLLCLALPPEPQADPVTRLHNPVQNADVTWIHPKALGPGALMASVSVLYGAVLPFAPLIGHEKGMDAMAPLYLLYTAGVIVTRSVSGALSDRYGRAAVLIPAMALSGVSVWCMAFTPTSWGLLLSALAYGLTGGAVQPSLMAMVADRLEDGERASAMATFTMFGDFGMALGSLIIGGLSAWTGYGGALAFPALIALSGATALWMSHQRQSRATAQASN